MILHLFPLRMNQKRINWYLNELLLLLYNMIKLEHECDSNVKIPLFFSLSFHTDLVKIRDMIRKYALFEGYEVEEAEDGMAAVERCRTQDFDLIIMDVMMPNLDGFSACKEIQKMKNIPVIMLSARGEEYDKLHGFEIGVDDYVVKPFSPKELMMRVQAVLKRVQGTHSNPMKKDLFTFQGLTLDFSARVVTIDGERVDMTPKEYALFAYLVKNEGIA